MERGERGEESTAKKSSVVSRPERLITVTSEEIKNGKWTEEELQMFDRLAAKQAAGDGRGVYDALGFSVVPDV